MAHCTRRTIRFSSRKRCKVGAITGNGVVMLVREQDRRCGLTAGLAWLVGDSRQLASCRHSNL